MLSAVLTAQAAREKASVSSVEAKKSKTKSKDKEKSKSKDKNKDKDKDKSKNQDNEPKTTKGKKPSREEDLGPTQIASVVIDGAIIYSAPNFDAPVMTYLREGQKINISQKLFGAFYRVELGKSQTGYISDIDVKVPGKEFTPQGPFADDESASVSHAFSPRSLLENVYLGVTGGYVYYSEPLGAMPPLDPIEVYGLKASGPGIVLDGPFVVDFTVKAFLRVPSYYQEITEIEPTGYGVFADTVIVLPYESWLGLKSYYGLGVHFLYTDYTLTRSGKTLLPKELKAGAVGLVGLGLTLGRFGVKIEGKGYYDRSLYGGWEASLQYAFY